MKCHCTATTARVPRSAPRSAAIDGGRVQRSPSSSADAELPNHIEPSGTSAMKLDRTPPSSSAQRCTVSPSESNGTDETPHARHTPGASAPGSGSVRDVAPHCWPPTSGHFQPWSRHTSIDTTSPAAHTAGAPCPVPAVAPTAPMTIPAVDSDAKAIRPATTRRRAGLEPRFEGWIGSRPAERTLGGRRSIDRQSLFSLAPHVNARDPPRPRIRDGTPKFPRTGRSPPKVHSARPTARRMATYRHRSVPSGP